MKKTQKNAKKLDFFTLTSPERIIFPKNNLAHQKIVQNKKKYEKYFTIVLFMTHNMCYNDYRKQD